MKTFPHRSIVRDGVFGKAYQTAVPNIAVAPGSTRELTPSETLYTDSIDYLLGGALTLRNGRIDKFQFDEGYCQAERYTSTKDDFTFCYYDTDHLGNVRQVTELDGSRGGNVIQRNNYYPFGAEFCDGNANTSGQSRKYNGKEFDNMHGLNTYDYGARQYNPVTARWDRIDPLAHKYFSVSPYVYCANNPMRFIDPDGREFTDSSWKFINLLLNKVDRKIDSYLNKINKTQRKIDSGKYSDKKVNRYQMRIDNYSSKISQLNEIKSEVDRLEESSQMYNITKSNRLSTTTDDRSGSYYNTETEQFDVVWSGSNLGMLAHELKHAYQFETGALSSGLNFTGIPFYDQSDEWEAYRRGALLGGPTLSVLPELYSKLQGGPVDYRILNEMQMKNLKHIANQTKSAFRINGVTYNGIPEI